MSGNALPAVLNGILMKILSAWNVEKKFRGATFFALRNAPKNVSGIKNKCILMYFIVNVNLNMELPT